MSVTFVEAAPVRRANQQRRLEEIDAAVKELGLGMGGGEVHFPVLIAREVLERADYHQAFPHLLLAAAHLRHFDVDDAALLGPDNLACSAWCLSPAVCYHVYAQLAGRELSRPQVITARGRCFRHEAVVAPGVRQIEFEMREIVLMGEEAWVLETAEAARHSVERLARQFGLQGIWQSAEDPFFLPRARGKAHLQRLLGLKLEFCITEPVPLALASVNRHGTFFGQRFGITDRSGQPIHTACIAAGLDRWAAHANPILSEVTPCMT
jgi:hypothetical protein